MNASVENWPKAPGKIEIFLRKALFSKLRALKNAQIQITDPLGKTVLGELTEQAIVVSVNVIDMEFYRKVALGGSIGAGETYMDGLWQVNDLTALVRILVRNRELLDDMEGGLATLANKLLKLWHIGNRNTTDGSRKNIAAHYDLGNDLFSLFLDSHEMYSSATFYQQDMSLEKASEAKLLRICNKLDLKQTDHLLEIGTGWGGFAVFAAKNYGCKVTTTTISEQQFQAAARRIHNAGLDDQITLLKEDYRNLQGKFDKLVSIEMIEAVGQQFLDTYLKCCAQLVKQNGLALIQAITIEDQRYQQALKSVDFIQRYIFPGSFIPCVSAIISSSARSTDLRLLNLEDQGDSYALTMRHWRENFLRNLEDVKKQGYSAEFIRMWEFYLAYCEGGFIEKSVSSVQVLFAKPQNRRQQWLPNYEA